MVLPLGALAIWAARRWVHNEIVSKLSNDDTTVAKYAHDARDYAKQALDASLQTNELMVKHITDREVHRVPR